MTWVNPIALLMSSASIKVVLAMSCSSSKQVVVNFENLGYSNVISY